MALDQNSENTEASFGFTENKSSMENVEKQDQNSDNQAINSSTSLPSERMVIYNADIQLTVKNYEKARTELERKAAEIGGYLVEDTTNRYGEEQLSGMMVFRIPQQHFSSFLQSAEEAAAEVTNRHVSGQDVTEEFVDLESRLRSKKAVEARLQSFLEEAEKTEDLLKISSDLSKVQEEIEQLTGRMNYLQNQTAYSTVTITLEENSILVPGIDNKELNTWQKVKKQLVVNINWLLSFLSGSIVLIAGNLPIIILLALVIGIPLVILRKRRNVRNEEKK
ncbi:DUF4349 domain-containing protein [Mesobacillus maritimus]|uniref:DUF4349 domain-containing protein n=2 Tax=Mesobacillus maritimus TaxID=1643336 RepID=A0ABS7K5Z9_9BACI|nr:DUF4349 domain-containing protein [Mesobacillus maritimus]